MAVNTAGLDDMDDAEDRSLWSSLSAPNASDDGQAARERLAAGLPIYIRDETTPAGLVIKQYPDGRRELVAFDQSGEKVVQAGA